MLPHATGTTTLTIRNIDVRLKERLRMRAARNGRSMESELRHIISAALAHEGKQEVNLAEAIHRRFMPFGGLDALPTHPPMPIGTPPSFDE